MSRSDDDEVANARFRDQVRPRLGEWNFAGVYERPADVARSQAAIAADSFRLILEGTRRDMQASHTRDMVCNFMKNHADTVSAYAYADALTQKRNTDKCYQDSLIVGRDKYKQFMDSFIDTLRDAMIDFKKMTDVSQPHAADEALKLWMDNPRKLGRLQDALKMANVETSKNDLRITDQELAEKIRTASDALLIVRSAFESLAEQQFKIRVS